MTLSAAFTVNGDANPAEHSVAYDATVTMVLQSITGADSISWSIVGASKTGVTYPTITLSGTPSGSTATWTQVSDPGDDLGRTFLVKCTVSNGRDTATEYAVVGTANTNGIIPVAVGEENYRDATQGWTDVINSGLASPISTSWSSYTPAISSSGGGASIGDGTVAGKYRRLGNSVEVMVRIVFGSTTTFGTGSLIVSTPSISGYVLDSNQVISGGYVPSFATFQDSSSMSSSLTGWVSRYDNGDVQFYPTTSSSLVSATVPFTWAQNDVLMFHATIPMRVNGG